MYGIQSWERSREVRLGLVMYGGVSLAVYENGVAQEMHRAVRGEGIYGLIKELTDSDVIVDIVSGTSAGGINGILLCHALANNRRFSDSAKLWREDGDILRLMRSTSDPSTASLLDSEGYYQPKLQQAFQKMKAYDASDASPYQSDVKELDLFVTGTDIDGNVYTVFDDKGHAIDVRDHKAVFQLSYRKNRNKNEFDVINHPVRAEALAKLSRITSCFPVAFAPVAVSLSPNREEADGLLQIWGKLGRSANFLDGGVLDNKPFSYTTDAIFSRSADRDVDRFLLYVEPDPERFQKNHQPNPPNVLEAAMKALIAIPGYESISADLAEINERNRKLALQEELADCVRKNARKLGAHCLDGDDDPQVAGMKAVEEADPVRYRIYRMSRLAQLRDRALLGILKNKGNTQRLQNDKRDQAELLAKAFGDLSMGSDLDVYFRIRRLFHVIYFIKGILWDDERHKGMDNARQGACRELWRGLNHMLQLLEIIRYFMEYLVDEMEVPLSSMTDSGVEEERTKSASKIWGKVNNHIKQLLRSDEIRIPKPVERNWKATETKQQWEDAEIAGSAQRDAVAGPLRQRAASLAAQAHADPYDGRILLQETDLMERELLLAFQEHVPKEILEEYCRFPQIDSHLFPIELLSGIHAKDRIRTVRLSPIDAQRGLSDQTLVDKLCGDQLGHFSGFLKRSWRSNDIMWGRLDSVCQLIECLLSRDRIAQAPKKSPTIAVDIDPKTLFPHSSPEVIQLLDADLKQLRTLAEKGGTAYEDFLNRFVLAAQMEVFAEEVPKIVEDAIGQQVEWNQYAMSIVQREETTLSNKSSLSFDLGAMSWSAGNEKIDPILT
ncbi:MAG: patatin-like protein, partial [Acidobacteriia bacterium]|nr:patatin-like protein [Terriglobia bacterium]